MTGSRKPLLDLQNPFFRPMWRRIALVAFLAVWTGIEIAMGSPYWAILTGGIGAWAAFVFFVRYDADAAGSATPENSNEEER